MKAARAWFFRLAGLFHKDRRERDLSDEFETHIQLQTDDNIRSGISPLEARRQALLKFGGREQIKESYRDRRGLPALEMLAQDIRYGLRVLAASPAFTAVALLSLALGIGANTAIFSLVNALLLRPLPVPQSDQLVRVRTWASHTSYPNYADLRSQNDVFSDITGHRVLDISLDRGDSAVRVLGELVTPNYFTLLGVQPAAGRAFTEADARSADSVAVVSHAFWQRHYAGESSLVGREVALNGRKYIVIGVMPDAFHGTFAWGLAPEVWLPLSAETFGAADALTNRRRTMLELIGRLKPGVSATQAQAAIKTIAGRLELDYPEANRNLSRVTISALTGIDSFGGLSGRQAIFAFLTLLGLVVGLVLLIACANVANLLLARAAARQREIAIRISLGAGRMRLVRQLLTESLLLALLGAAAGVLLALAAPKLLAPLGSSLPVQVSLDVSPDWRVLSYTLALAILTAMLFGLKPALAATGAQPSGALKGADGVRSRPRGRFNFRGILVIGQVAVSFALLICGGLFVRSMQNVHQAEPGFNIDHGLTAAIRLPATQYTESKGRAFYIDLLDRTRALPGVVSASLANIIPLTLENRRGPVWRDTDPRESPGLSVYSNIIGPDYFATLSIPVLRGREFNLRDTAAAPRVVIINETLARRLWPDGEALGRRIRVWGGDQPALAEIVAVVKDSKYGSLGEEPAPILYEPLFQSYSGDMKLHVRVAGDPAAMLAPLKRATEEADRSLAVDVRTMSDNLQLAFLPARLGATLLGCFGFLGMLLASAGIFGVIAYSVSSRLREIGIRIALGARPGSVLRLVIGDGMLLVAIGMGLGLLIALSLTRVAGSFLVGVTPTDPITYVAVLALLGAVAVLASYLPARRALKVDPSVTLRYE